MDSTAKASDWLLLFLIFLIVILLCTGATRLSMRSSVQGDTEQTSSTNYLDQNNVKNESETGMTSSFNAIWCYFGEVNASMLAKLVAGKIFNIYIWFQPFPDHTIHYPYSDAQITTMLNTVRAYDSRFKIYAWIGSYPHNETGQIDLSTSEYRQAMINAVVGCVNKGFDGIQDNIEDTVNSDFQDRADYWNNETVALHAINKINIPITGWGTYWEDLLVMIQADYVIGGWSIFDGNYKSDLDYALKHVISPMLIDISLDASLTEQLSAIDEMISETGPYPNLVGFSLYIYGNMTSGNWTTWNNWATKDPFVEPPPEPPIPPPPAEYYTVNVSAGVGGQATPAGSNQVLVGTNFNVHASANTDYLFSNWTRNGVQVSANPNYTITNGTANSTYQMVANFTYNPPTPPPPPPPPEPEYWSVNVQAGTGGSTSASGVQTLEVDQSLTVTAEPHQNYRFTYWLYDSTNYSASLTVIIPSGVSESMHTLLAVFQVVEPSPPPSPSLPASEAVGILSGNVMFTRVFGKIQRQKPLEFDDLINALKKAKF